MVTNWNHVIILQFYCMSDMKLRFLLYVDSTLKEVGFVMLSSIYSFCTGGINVLLARLGF